MTFYSHIDEGLFPMTTSGSLGGGPFGSAPITYPATTGKVYASGGMIGTVTTAATIKTAPKKPRTVTLPPRITSKMLIAFLEDTEERDDKTVWAKKLAPKDFRIEMDGDGELTLHLEISLHDVYDNEPEE